MTDSSSILSTSLFEHILEMFTHKIQLSSIENLNHIPIVTAFLKKQSLMVVLWILHAFNTDWKNLR